ncbi:MAG: S8 family serine peptidase, partial [Cyanobacteria bacterium J06558_2]
SHNASCHMRSGQQAQQMGVKDRAIPKGIAPEARLIFQAVEKTPKWTSDAIFYYLQETDCMPPVAKLCGIPDDIQKLFSKAYAQGARIHSNSWGEEVDGIYDEKCVDLDEFVWNHKDFLVIVAAGNSGSHSSSGIPGIDQGSVASPAAAKNCLTVGASEHNHEGQFQDTYGQRNPDSFPYAPYNNDNIADNTDDIAAFSSRGPCQDGRRKPDLVAPGTYVLSTRSSQIAENNFAEGYYSPAKDHYMYMSGTSMATPLVAGCAAKVREYLRKMEKIEQPSAALIKASLIHSAQHVKYRYCHKNSVPPADNEQGWGRICLKKVLDPNLPTQVIFIDQKQGLEGDGTEHRYQIKVINDSVLLRVTLVYTDFPGTEETEEQVETKPLVNNLNLTLYPPTHEHRRYYQGNDFDNEGNIDNCNNVEGCIVEQKEVHTGTWTINVVGSDVSRAPQDYALVISGGIDRDSLEEFI